MAWLKVRSLLRRSDTQARDVSPEPEALGGPSDAFGLESSAWWGSRLSNYWAARSALIGAGSSLCDYGLGTFLATVAHVPTRIAAMTALTLGTTLTFVLNRRFAFRETKIAGPAVRFAAVSVCEILVHGQLMVLLHDGHHLPYVPAKLLADLMVFTAVHLMLLRYVVFPRARVV